ncbi:Protein phosphatase [Gracilaria domingensis]|nr:Protein phosphatase [Gracilaria domingensis]
MFIAQRVEAYLLRSLLPNRHDPQFFADVLHRAMLYAEHKLESPPVTVDYSLSGSTGTFLLIHNTTLYCANVGDSRAILGRVQPQLFESHRSEPFPTSDQKRPRCLPDHYTAIPISIDQKPSRPDEMERLLAAGARVDDWEGIDVGETRVWRPDVRSPGLAVSRSFGDLEVKRYGVSCDPEIFSLDLHPDDHFLVLGSDGIFEFLSNDDIISFVANCREEGSAQEAAEKLVRLATEKWIEDDSIIDDISCIVVFLDVSSDTTATPQLPTQLHPSPSSMPGSYGSGKSSTASDFSPADRVIDHIATPSSPSYVGHSSLEFPQRPRAISVHTEADLSTFADAEVVERKFEEYDDALEIV